MLTAIKMGWGRLRGEKAKRLIVEAPSGPDGRLVMYKLDKTFLRELESRGYDLRTLKFTIKKQDGPYQPIPDDCL